MDDDSETVEEIENEQTDEDESRDFTDDDEFEEEIGHSTLNYEPCHHQGPVLVNAVPGPRAGGIHAGSPGWVRHLRPAWTHVLLADVAR